MTWSIVALDASGALGVAVASRFLAVGALCPAVSPGRGALSTQALINPLFSCAGLNALEQGVAARQVVERLIAADPGRESRQLHVVDASGRSAAHTGAECIPVSAPPVPHPTSAADVPGAPRTTVFLIGTVCSSATASRRRRSARRCNRAATR